MLRDYFGLCMVVAHSDSGFFFLLNEGSSAKQIKI